MDDANVLAVVPFVRRVLAARGSGDRILPGYLAAFVAISNSGVCGAWCFGDREVVDFASDQIAHCAVSTFATRVKVGRMEIVSAQCANGQSTHETQLRAHRGTSIFDGVARRSQRGACRRAR